MASMIKIRIQEVAKEKGITTAYQLQKAMSLPPSLAAKWFRNNLTSISFNSLDMLCEFFDCQVNDLIEYTKRAEE